MPLLLFFLKLTQPHGALTPSFHWNRSLTSKLLNPVVILHPVDLSVTQLVISFSLMTFSTFTPSLPSSLHRCHLLNEATLTDRPVNTSRWVPSPPLAPPSLLLQICFFFPHSAYRLLNILYNLLINSAYVVSASLRAGMSVCVVQWFCPKYLEQWPHILGP